MSQHTTGRKARRANKTKFTAPGASPHSVRISDETWQQAKEQAMIEEVPSMSRLVSQLLEGYVAGAYKLPTLTYE